MFISSYSDYQFIVSRLSKSHLFLFLKVKNKRNKSMQKSST